MNRAVSSLEWLPKACVSMSAAGLASHYMYWIRGEPDTTIMSHIKAAGLINVATCGYLVVYGNVHFLFAPLVVLLLSLSYIASLFGSIVIYRCFFHPLRGFPGRKRDRASKLFAVWENSSDRLNYRHIEGKHKTFGDLVRVGPRELSIVSVEAAQSIYGTGSKCRKGQWYAAAERGYNTSSVHTQRDRSLRDPRRKVWDRAVGGKALLKYEPRVSDIGVSLMRQLSLLDGQDIHVNKWFGSYAFDVMADVGWNTSFNMVESGEMNDHVAGMHNAIRHFMSLGQIPWVAQIIRGVLGEDKINKDYYNFLMWCGKQTKNKKKALDSGEDPSGAVMSQILSSDLPNNDLVLRSDAELLIVAGSDTTATTSLAILCFLAQNPDVYGRLQKDIDEAAASGDLSNANLSKVTYLDAVINEALRLMPPVPSGLNRVTPPEGLDIADVGFIPGNMVVHVAPWLLHRDKRYWVDPLSFRPERWMPEGSHLTKDKRAFIPFGLGTYMCAGRHLATMELRVLFSKLMCQFDFRFPETENGQKFLQESKDHFTFSPADLRMVFTLRQGNSTA